MNVEQGFVPANGTRLYYEAAGAGQPVVLLHGFTFDTTMWDDQFLPLAQHFRVSRYDMRGFGRSDLPGAEPYSHADDLKALLDHLDIRQAHLAGLSKGGAIALDFALTYPQHTGALVLIDTVLGGFDWSAETNARNGLVWQRASEGGIAAAKQSWLTHPLFAPAQRQAPVAARLADILERYSGWHFVNANPEQSPQPPAAQRLHELRMPLLAMVGEQDVADFVRVTELICREVPQARKLTVPGVGHMANMEAPRQVTEAMVAFLSEVAAG